MAKLEWEKATRRESTRREPDPIVSWWWTPSRGGRCGDCGEPMPKGSRIAYNHIERLALCEICVDARGLMPSVSKAWRLKTR